MNHSFTPQHLVEISVSRYSWDEAISMHAASWGAKRWRDAAFWLRIAEQITEREAANIGNNEV